ncbi:MAG: hypothetical protein KKA51_02845, partial [Nanoarchaeota archaeon]|nr:hypothetical protein [Nanoarchaeota archaeon]
NGSFYRDFDNDTFGVNPSLNICYGLLDPPSGYSYNNTDCDDSVFSCNTGANNCTAMNYLDTDQDRYCDSPTVSLRRCDAPPLYNVTNISMCTDCNNTNQLIWRNGTFCVNKDGDAYGLPPLVIVCYGALDPPINYSYSCVDCDDSVPNTWGVGNLVVKYKGSTVAAIDNYGVLALKGGVSVVDPITGIPPSFNVKDDVGDVVSAITSAGDLYTILGVTNMFSSPIVPTASQDLIIKRSGTNLAMFTKRGAVQVRCVMPNFNFSGTPIG